MNTLSVVVLTHNSQETLENCLSSVSFADELVVIDDYSSDKTLQIASKHNAIIFQHKLANDFAKQRSFGLTKTTNDWVLFVDSDEIVPKALSFEIEKILSSNTDDFGGFYLKRNDVMWGKVLKNGEIGNLRILRLGNKQKGKWTGSVHEIWDMKGRVGELTSPLMHFPHRSIGDFLKEINYYTSLRAEELYRKKVRVYGISILAYPTVKFILNYIFRFGFLDGTQGLMLSITMSFHSFLVRSKLWQLYDQKNRQTA